MARAKKITRWAVTKNLYKVTFKSDFDPATVAAANYAEAIAIITNFFAKHENSIASIERLPDIAFTWNSADPN